MTLLTFFNFLTYQKKDKTHLPYSLVFSCIGWVITIQFIFPYLSLFYFIHSIFDHLYHGLSFTLPLLTYTILYYPPVIYHILEHIQTKEFDIIYFF